MERTDDAWQRKGPPPPIDVLAFPPDKVELRRRQLQESDRWIELERRARVALFFCAGMFLAWAVDVIAAFEIRHAAGSAWFGVASVPIAVIVVLAYIVGRWVLERAARGRAEVQQRYSDVTQKEAIPLIQLAKQNAVVAQYLRCVGRQRRALSRIERIALDAWAESAHAQPGR